MAAFLFRIFLFHCPVPSLSSLGATSILHDSELPTDVGHCADPGCYSRAVRYRNATMRKMIALADLSSECHQTIQVKTNWYITQLITESISFFPFLHSISTIAISHRSIWTASLIPGGTTGTELPCISGRGAIPASTPVSAESTTIAPNPLWLATAILPHPFY